MLWSKLTWFQFFLVPTGSFFHRFTSSTQALQISPDRVSFSLHDDHSLWGNGTEEKRCSTCSDERLTQNSSWSLSRSACCLWSESWRTLPGRYSIHPNSCTFLAYESQTSAHRKYKKKSCIYFSFNTLSSQPVSIACSLQYLAEAEGHVSGSDQKVIFYSNSAVCIYLHFSHKRGALKTCRGSGFCRSISPLWPTWGEVGQQSDRSCHHAARTGCIFGKAKTQTSRSAILHAATHALQTVVKRRGKLQNLWIALPMRCKIIKCVWRWIGGGGSKHPDYAWGELWFMLLGKI